MTDERETIADILKDMRERCIDREHSPTLWPYLDRIEAAHRRRGELYKRLLRTSRAALEVELGNVAELRECLHEAVNNECNYCRTVHKDGTYGRSEHLTADGECDHLRGVKCTVHKWRKALEGANNEGK